MSRLQQQQQPQRHDWMHTSSSTGDSQTGLDAAASRVMGRRLQEEDDPAADAADEGEEEVLLDSELEGGVPDSEWTQEGAVATSSHVFEDDDSADEWDVEFDEAFEFSDDEGLRDTLPQK